MTKKPSGHRLAGVNHTGLSSSLQKNVLILKVIRLKDRLAFTRRHGIVSVHEKTGISRAEITHVSIRDRS